MKKNTLLFIFLMGSTFGFSQTYVGSNTTVTVIPDDDLVTGVTLLVNMTGIPTSGVEISDIEIDMAINHPWVGDLLINIEAPSGQSIVIRPDAIGNGDSSNMISTSPVTFTDSGTVNAIDMGITITGAQFICQDDGECSFKPNAGTSPDTFADLITAIGADNPNGDWKITVFDALGGGTGDFFVPSLRVITMTLGLDENEMETFNIYPNPVSNNLTFDSSKSIETISVINMLGQEIIRTAPNTLKSTLKMSDLSSGSYIVKVTVDGDTVTRRIVKD